MDADLQSYFDTVTHDRLLALVQEREADGRVLAPSGISNLNSQISAAGVLEENKVWHPTERGTPGWR